MEIREISGAGKPFIEAYGPGRFTIGDRVINGALLVLPDRWVPLDVAGFDHLDEDILTAIKPLMDGLDILLIGTGASMALVPGYVREWALEAHMSIDPMDSGAAARTFNVLLSEERRVAALLFPV
ncbi:membrane protein [Iodidimonas muriae]|uniref:Membrane protein n=1 Tax=Iodidimonas muriae TaxID=261467 RepID=A0ABQ2LE07_9PROT|nr:Mth938-like domain-containing protein [Iodidimonas muriae]GER07112.1 membrane protein [Kordiimonadales bacterium JCM 17843]GGO12951.1 membrane protein [Iodidimonas muriae]